ncbi:MAG: hypothetical protein ACRCT8_04405 [Lacipirellulaceae bacterium]
MTNATHVVADHPAGPPARAGRGKVGQAHDAFVAIVAEASKPGFFGVVSLAMTVQDGNIQHVRVTTDRTLR